MSKRKKAKRSGTTIAAILGLLLPITVLGGMFGAPERALAAAMDKDQQACVNEMNKNGEKVNKTQLKKNESCLKAYQKGKLAVSVEACTTADLGGKVQRAEDRTVAQEGKKCLPLTAPPPFAYTNAATVNAAAVDEALELVHAIFDDPISDGILATNVTDKDTAKCQQEMLRRANILQGTALKEILRAKKNAIKEPAVSDAGALEAALAPVLSSSDKIVKKQEQLVQKVDKKCSALQDPPSTIFPGACAAPTLLEVEDCVIAAAHCAACQEINAFDALNLDCDAACGVVDPTLVLFDPDRLLNIDITMAPADWDVLRIQSRDLVNNVLPCAEVPRTRPYTFFHADVTIDGATLQDVGVRKKGFQGSLSTARPSLKVDFTEFVSGQQYQGMDRLTLNNNRQDTSKIQTCLAYHVLRRAGVPAPRCNFAHVTVNGQDLGIYSNVESIKSPFLVRNFGDATGNLYEGTVSDLRAGFFGTFEVKNGGNRDDLLALAHLLEGTDAEILAEIDQHMNVDAFLTFWAMEGLIGHWDGYNQGNNNFWIYNDPVTKLRFIPWGADATFGPMFSFIGQSAAISPAVFLSSQLAVRLYGIPSLRQQYLDRLLQLRSTHFPQGGDPALVSEIDQMELLTNDPADPGSDPVVTGAIAGVRQWVQDRYDHVEAEIGPNGTNPPPAPGTGSLAPRFCLQVLPGDGVWFDIDVLATNAPAQSPTFCALCQSTATVYGITYQAASPPLQAFDPNQNPVSPDEFGLLNVMLTEPLATAIVVSLDPSLVTEVPGTVNIPDGLGNGTIVSTNISIPGSFFLLGLLTNTQLDLTTFGSNPGDRVTGQLTSEVATFTPAPANPLPPLPMAP